MPSTPSPSSSLSDSPPPKVVDPDSQENTWAEIGGSRVQVPLDVKENGEINSPPSEGEFLKLVLISDTHCRMGEMIKQGRIPDGDVLIHAGDITSEGNEPSLRLFNEELGRLPHRHKVVIAGNHELGFDPHEDQALRKKKYQGLGTPEGYKLFTNCTFLNDSEVVIDGVKFYGSSWHPLPQFPFYQPREALKEKWEKIPNDVDVLITHSPPLGHLDLYPPVERWGCRYLLEKVEKLCPSLHVFGHVHYCYGCVSNGPTTFVNAASEHASKDGSFNRPIIYYIPKKV